MLKIFVSDPAAHSRMSDMWDADSPPLAIFSTERSHQQAASPQIHLGTLRIRKGRMSCTGREIFCWGVIHEEYTLRGKNGPLYKHGKG